MKNGITLENVDGKFLLKGELTFDSVPAVLKQNIFTKAGNVVIDLSGVMHSDSSGLALLVQWWRQAKTSSVNVQFENIPQKMMALAKVSNLDKVLPLVSH